MYHLLTINWITLIASFGLSHINKNKIESFIYIIKMFICNQ